jgi:hypothetical protein
MLQSIKERARTVLSMRDLDGGNVSIERHWPGAYTIKIENENATVTAFIGPTHLVRLILALRKELHATA